MLYRLADFEGRLLYAYTVLLYIYRLRQMGQRVDRTAMRSHGGMHGDFVLVPSIHEYYGKRPLTARLLARETSKDLLPPIENARVLRVRRGITVAGNEVLAQFSKSKGERYRQTWVCVVEPIAPEEWPAPPRTGNGFDIADDDANY